MFYTIPLSRTVRGEPAEGKLYFAVEGRHTHLIERKKEILHFRFLPIVWTEDDPPGPLPAETVRYAGYKPSGWRNTFQLCADHDRQAVRFGPSDNIEIEKKELRGLGVGSHLWRILIRWAKRKFPEYAVHPIKISELDAEDEEDFQRRNHFFEKHGFTPQFSDPEGKSGVYRCEKVSDLKESALLPLWKAKSPTEMMVVVFDEREDAQRSFWFLLRNYDELLKSHIALDDRQTRLKAFVAVSGICLFVLLAYKVLSLF